MPGFIDAHSHITAFAQTLGLVDLSKCTNIKQIILKLQEYKNENKLIDGKWIVGFGYDNNLLEEKRHPSNIELDEATKKNPILISHVSGHMGVTNTIGLKAMNINEETKNPEGGSYGRSKTTGKLNGYMEESAFITNAKIANELSNEEYVELIERAQRIYLKNGIKTGVEKFYRTNGCIYKTIVYKNGVRNGIAKKYNQQNNLKVTISYKNDEKNGVAISYGGHSWNNHKIGRVPYKKGIIDGMAKTYYDDKSVKSEVVFENGRKISVIKYKKGEKT